MLTLVLFQASVRFRNEAPVSPWPVGKSLAKAQKIDRSAMRTASQGSVGRPPRDLRQILEGIFHILRCGYPWRDLPERFGPWQTVYGRFRLWSRQGLWPHILGELAKGAKGTLRFIDGSYVRVHQDGAPALALAEVQGVGTSRGGRNSKLHALVDLYGRPLKILITPGNIHDITAAPQLVAGLTDSIIVADKGYDSAAFRTALEATGNRSSIPKRKGSKSFAPCNRAYYRKRHRVENFFARIKRLRRIATRYEKTRTSFEAFLMIAAILDWIR